MNKILKVIKRVTSKLKYNSFLIINNYIFKGDVFSMVMVYVTAIVKGLVKFSDVPVTLKQKVANTLIAMDLEDLIDDPAYQKPKTNA